MRLALELGAKCSFNISFFFSSLIMYDIINWIEVRMQLVAAIAKSGQQARSLSTQTALMEAAEKLVAQKGLAGISIKDIVREAGQKNESALQYHFKNLKGLIRAINKKRSLQIHEKRAELLEELMSQDGSPDVTDLCRLMVMPSFLLGQEDPKFRKYIAGFSHEVALAPNSAFDLVKRAGGGGESGQKMGQLLRSALPHLDDEAFVSRMEQASRLCAVSMAHQANQTSAFQGKSADLFVSNLIDALMGLLSAPESEQTKKLRRKR